MIRPLAVLATLAALAGVAACSVDRSPPVIGWSKLAPETIVATRQAAFRTTAQHLQSVRHGARTGNSDDLEVAGWARRAAQYAAQLPEGFPAGSGVGTFARPEIWTEPEAFRHAAATYAAASYRLAELVRREDWPAATAQLEEVRANCIACHDRFVVPDRRTVIEF